MHSIYYEVFPQIRKRFDVLCVLYLRRILIARIVVIVVGTYCNFAATVAVTSACGVAVTVGITFTLLRRAVIMQRQTFLNAITMQRRMLRNVALITVIITDLGVARAPPAVARAVVATNDKKTVEIFRRLYFYRLKRGK